MKSINEKLLNATEDSLERVDEILSGADEAFERCCIFNKVVEFITDCSDVQISDKYTGAIEAIGAGMFDDISFIHPLLTDKIEL